MSIIKRTQDVFNMLKLEDKVLSVLRRIFQDPKILKNF